MNNVQDGMCCFAAGVAAALFIFALAWSLRKGWIEADAKEEEEESAPEPFADLPGFNLELFKARLRGMAGDDVLVAQLLSLHDANIRLATASLALPGMDDAEAHRWRGRIGAMLDLRNELQDLWNETHPAAAAKGE